MELFFWPTLAKKRASYKKHSIPVRYNIIHQNVCTCVFMWVCTCLVYSLCVNCFFPFISMRERHFFVFSFFFLLLRYVKFFSHIRRKKSSNKVQLTHGGSTAFHSFSFSFIFKNFYFVFEYRKETQIEGIDICLMPLS